MSFKTSIEFSNFIKKTIVFSLCFFIFCFSSLTSLYANPSIIAKPVSASLDTRSINFDIKLKGLKVDLENPFIFELLLDANDYSDNRELVKRTSQKYIQYFLAALTLPDSDKWVNLSPYEPDRIMPEGLENTDLGQDMLLADELLKRSAASATDPNTESGKAYWDFLRAAGVESSTDELSKIWVVPASADLNVSYDKVYISNSKLKLETAMDNGNENSVVVDAIKKFIIPTVEESINSGAEFKTLRQIYNAFVLSVWYKKALKNSIINKVYTGKKKLSGVDSSDSANVDIIYQSYVDIFQKGIYDYVRKERDERTGRLLKRRYFSGGMRIGSSSSLETFVDNADTWGEIPEVEVQDLLHCRFEIVDSKKAVTSTPMLNYSESVKAIIDEPLFNLFNELENDYQKFIKGDQTVAGFYHNHSTIVELLDQMQTESFDIEAFKRSKNIDIFSMRESLLNVIGAYFAIAQKYNDYDLVESLSNAQNNLYGEERRKLQEADIDQHILTAWDRFIEALNSGKEIVLVAGHSSPDMDTLLTTPTTSLLYDIMYGGDDKIYIPMKWGNKVEDVMSYVLGEEVANAIPNAGKVVQTLREHGKLDKAKWLVLDHNNPGEFLSPYQEMGLSSGELLTVLSNRENVIDHHEESGDIKHRTGIVAVLDETGSVTGWQRQTELITMIEKSGSTAGLVAQKAMGLGMTLPYKYARILAAAALMDTDNCKKMNDKDISVLEAITRPHQIYGKQLYMDIRKIYLENRSPDEVAARDSKHIAGSYWFSVDEVAPWPRLFDSEGNIINQEFYDQLIAAQKKILKAKNMPFSICKIIDFQDDYGTVNSERIVLLFNDDGYLQLKEQIMNKILEIYKSEHVFNKKQLDYNLEEAYIQFSGFGDHVQRKDISNRIYEEIVQNKHILIGRKNKRYSSSSINQISNFESRISTEQREVGGIKLNSDLVDINQYGSISSIETAWSGNVEDFESFNGFSYNVIRLFKENSYN